MQKNPLLLICLLALLNTGFYCTSGRKKGTEKPVKVTAITPHLAPQVPVHADPNGQWQPIVMIQTTEGEIRIKLYNETPLHRDNFLKLVHEHYYDSLLFH